MQVCVPATWTDEEVVMFAEEKFPAGTRNGWHVRKAGDELLHDSPERVNCAEREGFVHVMLDV